MMLLLACSASAACRKPPAPRGRDAAEAAKATPERPAGDETIPESVRLTPAAISEAGITTWKVQPVDLEHMLVLTGSVEYDENRLLQIAANVKGRAASIRVDLGARVRKGDPILEIESVELGQAREVLLRELSGLRVSARAYERAKKLVEAKAISTGEFQARGRGLPRPEGGGGGGRSGRSSSTASATTRPPRSGVGRVRREAPFRARRTRGSSSVPRSTVG